MSLIGFEPWYVGRSSGRAGFGRRLNGIAVYDLSAWLSTSDPVDAATSETSGTGNMFAGAGNGLLAALILPLIFFGGDSSLGGTYRLDPPYISITLVPLVEENAPSQAVQRYPGLTYRTQRRR